MTAQHDDPVRRAFEEWWTEPYEPEYARRKLRRSNGRYLDMDTYYADLGWRYAVEWARKQQELECANLGHGHVFPRPDGVRARCGGPAICSECSRDLARKQQESRR